MGDQHEHIPVHCCPGCRRGYDEELHVPHQLKCGCALCAPCIQQRTTKSQRNATCADGHPLNATEAVPSKVLLQLVYERREFCPLHQKKIEIWCPACQSGLCITCHMGDDHMRRCASIQQLEITTPAAADAVHRRAQEMISNFTNAEAKVANAPLPPLESYSAEALMNRMRDLAIQARQAFDERLFEVVSANLELALGHQIAASYKSMEDRHNRLVLLQHASRQIQEAETLAHTQPAAAAAKLRRFSVDPEIGKPLHILPQLRVLDGIRLEVEPVWRDIQPETLSILEDEAVSTLAITEAENHRIKIIRSDGTFVRHLGSARRPGSSELEFAGVRGIGLLSDGQTLAVSEMENHRVKFVKMEGTFIGNVGTGRPGTGELEFNGPRGIAVLGDDSIAVCDFGNHRIKIINSEGQFIRHIGSGKPGSGDNDFNKPIAVAVFGDGVTLAVTDVENARVKIVRSDGTFVRHIGQGHRPGTKRGINELDFNVPLGLCVLGDGCTLAICDSENHRVKIVRGDDGTFIRHLGSGVPGIRAGDFHGPCGVTCMQDGATLVVTDFENHRLKIIRSDGAFIRHIGGGPATRAAMANQQMQHQTPPGPGGSSAMSYLPSTFRHSGGGSPTRKSGKGEKDFSGPWAVCCLDQHAGSPTRGGGVHGRSGLLGGGDLPDDGLGSRTPSQVPNVGGNAAASGPPTNTSGNTKPPGERDPTL